jgi:HAD superfamily hydrolase (TIGR01549 family)
VPIDTILLDAGGVLTFPNWARVSDTLARHGVDVAAEALRAAEPRAKFAIDTASHVAATNDADRGSRYFRLVFSGAGIAADAPIDAALNDLWAYHGEHNLWEHVPAEVPAALQQLQSLGLPLAVASNANGALHRLFDRLGLSRYFVAICDSCVEGVEKPDPAFFRIVLERAAGLPETTIHVGDLYHVDIVGARRAGLRAILLDPHDLYAEYEVERVKSLRDLVKLVEAGRTDPHSRPPARPTTEAQSHREEDS